MLYITCQEREKKREKSNDNGRQFDHHKLPHATPHGRGYGDAST
jgi:hypothetical protein